MWVKTESLEKMMNIKTFSCVFFVNNNKLRGWWSQSFLRFINEDDQKNQFCCDEVEKYYI